MNALTLKDVTVQVGDFHLKEIGLTLEKGKVLGLVGRSGAGKTTLVKTITGVLERQAGTILYQGRHLDEDAVLVKRILGVVYDRPHFNIQGKPDALVKALRPYYPDFDQELYAAKMAEYGMNGRRRFASYSRGMQKRFMILLALCLRPEILLLDEPTSEMDNSASPEVNRVWKRRRHDSGNGNASTSASSAGSAVRSRIKASKRAIVQSGQGRASSAMASPACTTPASSTRRYQPVRNDSCTRCAMSATPKRSLSFQQG